MNATAGASAIQARAMSAANEHVPSAQRRCMLMQADPPLIASNLGWQGNPGCENALQPAHVAARTRGLDSLSRSCVPLTEN